MKVFKFSFLMLFFFLPSIWPGNANAQIEITADGVELNRNLLETQGEAAKENIIQTGDPVGIIIRDFPFEWDNIKTHLLKITEATIYQEFQGGEFEPDQIEGFDEAVINTDLESLHYELAVARVALEAKYFPYYLSQASDEATRKFLEKQFANFDIYFLDDNVSELDCYQWLSKGFIIPGVKIGKERGRETLLAIDEIFTSVRSDSVKEFVPFYKNRKNLDLFYKILKKAAKEFGSGNSIALNYFYDFKSLQTVEDRELSCSINERFYEQILFSPEPKVGLEFFRTFSIGAGDYEDKVREQIETRKQILANQ